MKKNYTLKNAFDNRYINMMILNLFFLLGITFFMAGEIINNNIKVFEYLFFCFFFIIICLIITIKRLIVYYHLSHHGIIFENVKYRILKDKKKPYIFIKHTFDDTVKEIKSYRHDIDNKLVNKKGNVDVLIDLQHPKYFYVFYK